MTVQPTAGPAIRVQGLEKSYKQLHVLRGVDFDVARGGIFALLGSNGAGKTTIVNILTRLLKGDAGTASVNGFDVATQAAAARKVSTYSGGMRRLDIAMSLIGNPPVVFLDEPTTGLDPQARIEVWQAVKELAEHGTMCCSRRSIWTRPNNLEWGSRRLTAEVDKA
jgi:ABC-2 type transport system ATP-binding protein